MWKRLRSPSGVKRGSRKHERPPSACARTRNASHIGAEQNHLCPVISYSAPGPPPFSGRRDGGVGAHVGAALLLGHRHAAQRARLVRRGDEPLAVVGQRQEARLPLLGQLRLLAKRRDHGVGHRDRAAHPGLDLREEHELRRPGHVGARARVAPRRARAAPGRSPAAAARARPGGTRPRRSGCRTGRECAASAGSRSPARPSAITSARPQIAPQLAGLVLGPVAALAAQRLDQDRVPLEDVVALERRRLVGDLVGRLSLRALGGGHGDILAPLGNRIRGASIASRPRMAHEVTFIPGDGTGPEIAEATRRVLEATGVEFEWDEQPAGEDVYAEEGNPFPDRTLESIKRNGVGIKGPTTTPVGSGLPLDQRPAPQGARPLRLRSPVQAV